MLSSLQKISAKYRGFFAAPRLRSLQSLFTEPGGRIFMAMGGRAGEVFTDINVTPLTDVFLVLLVIMILIAPLVNQTVLKVDPPSAGSAAKSQDDKGPKLNVEVSAAGTIKINGQLVNPPDTGGVMTAIKAEQSKSGKTDIPLSLQSDADALQKYVVAVMDGAAGCGIKQMRVLPLKNK